MFGPLKSARPSLKRALLLGVTSLVMGSAFMPGAAVALDFVNGRYRVTTTRTNLVTNNTFAGAVVGVVGSGGALPTGWLASEAGQTTEIISIGVRDGVPTMRIRVALTATGSQYPGVRVVTPVAASTQYTISTRYDQISRTGTASTAPFFNIQNRNGTTYVNNITAGAWTGGFVRQSATGTTTPATTAIWLLFDQTLTAGQTTDWTFDVAITQIELGAIATSYIPTYGTAVSVTDSGTTSTNFATLLGLTITRTGSMVTYAETTSGVLQPFYAARTNKCTNYNVNPQALTNVSKQGDAAATLTLVDDSAALAAIGLSGNVFKLDNSAGATSAWVNFSGQVGSTNPHVVSVYVRGSGTSSPQLSGTAGTFAGLTAAYQRRSNALTPAASTNVAQLSVTAGGIAYFILNQLEEGTVVTPPITVSGAAASVDAQARITDKGLLVEEARTNVVQQSGNPLAWNNESQTLADLGTNGPFRRVSVTGSSASPWSTLYPVGVSTFTASEPLAVTLWYEAGTTGKCRIKVRAGSTGREFYVDGNAGALAAPSTQAGLGTVSAVVNRTLANGVYSASFVFTPDTSATSCFFGISPNGTGSVIALGMQVERNATFPTSYIPTTTASATRGADIAYVSGLSISTPVTLQAWVNMNTSIDGVDRYFFNLQDASNANAVSIRRNTGNVARGAILSSSVGVGLSSAATFTGGVRVKSALRVRGAASTLAANGVLSAETASTNPAAPMTALAFGAGNTFAISPLNGYIELVTLRGDTSDAQLQALTQ